MIIGFLKLLTLILRTFTKNSGTALPGLILEKYFPKTLQKLFSQLDEVILVTGTNGKTTTTQMMCYLLNESGVDFVSNTSGSNLIRGIAASLLDKTKHGKLDTKLAIFEVEEASMPKLTKFVKPKVIVVTNIFRDQLDAYGEIDKTLRYIREAIVDSKNPKLILNGDDPRVMNLSNFTQSEVDFVTLDPKFLNQIKFESSNIEAVKQQTLNTNNWAIKINEINEDLQTTFNILGVNSTFSDLKINVPGIHNVVNATLSVVGLIVGGFESKLNFEKLTGFTPAFGRGEIIQIMNEGQGMKSMAFQILLAKNPAGMNLNLHLLENVKNREGVLLILNDKIADGKDVSWIWDVNFGLLKELGFQKVYVAGTRRWDLAIRMKYEGIKVEEVFESVNDAVDKLKDSEISKCFVLPTYTAMREFRESVSRYTKVKEIWKS